MRKILILVVGLYFNLVFSQTTEKQKDTIDSILPPLISYNTKYFTLGSIYDTTNSLFGIQIGNGNDEQPLIHFEDLTAEVLYKINGQTDFKNDYSIGGEISWNYPFKAKVSILSLNFNQRLLSEKDLFLRNIGLSSRYYLRFTSNLSILGKISHQTLNEQNNLGFGLGVENGHVGIYYGLRVDYFKEYYNYSAYVQSFLFKEKLSLRIAYERIDEYDFFNIGLNYIIIKNNR